jgi:hypothetical protein
MFPITWLHYTVLVLLSSGTLLPADATLSLHTFGLAQSISPPKGKKTRGMIAVKFPRLHNLSVSDVFSMCSPQRRSSCSRKSSACCTSTMGAGSMRKHHTEMQFPTLRFKQKFKKQHCNKTFSHAQLFNENWR